MVTALRSCMLGGWHTFRPSSVQMQQQVSADSAMSSPRSCLSTTAAPSASSLSSASYNGRLTRTGLSFLVVTARDQDAAASSLKAASSATWCSADVVCLEGAVGCLARPAQACTSLRSHARALKQERM